MRPPKTETHVTYETLRLRRVSPHVGAEVEDIDITRPLTNRQVEELHTALGEFGVLFFRDQRFEHDSQKRFGRYFGELDIHPNTPGPEGHPEILPIHADADSKMIAGERWHSDVSCRQEPPLGSILHLHTVPPTGGDTLFASLAAAYDALSPRMKAYLEGLTAFHSGERNYRKRNRLEGIDDTGRVFPSANHPVVIPPSHQRPARPLRQSPLHLPHQRGERGGERGDPALPVRARREAGFPDPLPVAAAFGRFLGQSRGAAPRDLGLLPAGAQRIARDGEGRQARGMMTGPWTSIVLTVVRAMRVQLSPANSLGPHSALGGRPPISRMTMAGPPSPSRPPRPWLAGASRCPRTAPRAAAPVNGGSRPGDQSVRNSHPSR
ncbi:TauD/TfdA dioxygenase family protein [Falsiroseomonas sp. HW251]|uniref:TauD/TfdA dioxygenase family protein n=1 Tax=Falsiroseomonas sp. HW251 TaxID=3390998 RepID=UPI003D317B1D